MANLENNYEMYTCSKIIYNLLFSGAIKKNQLNQVHLASLMPTLSGFLKKSNFIIISLIRQLIKLQNV